MAYPRAAVVIGVGRVDPLQELSSAADLAIEIARWLNEEEKYDVELLNDSVGPVTSRAVEESIRRFVTQPASYRQLLVYFIGHGYWQGRADRWLLTNASTSSSEAINLFGAMELARYSGIPNVIFISDACRSLPANLSQAQIEGIDGFPINVSVTTPSKVDVFKATTDARPAYEIPRPGGVGRISVLTWALRLAFEAPEAAMIARVRFGTQELSVVPNRRLEKFLQRAVNGALGDIDPGLIQRIEAIVPSDDDVFIAKVSPSPGPPSKAIPGRSDDASDVAAELLSLRNYPGSLPFVGRELMPDETVDHFESQCGVVVRGAELEDVLLGRDADGSGVDILYNGRRGQAAVARVHPATQAGSMLLRFQDGTGAIVPFLSGYIAHVAVTEAGVSQVAFVPSSNTNRWNEYRSTRAILDKYRAAVSQAIDSNSLVFGSLEHARGLARSIRVLKRVDPTLGVYAAHAYAQAGLIDEVRDVAFHMRRDLGVGLFDVELLGLSQGEGLGRYEVAPFCPLLTQTWSILRARKINLPDYLSSAQPYLRNSLWTTFDPQGVEIISLGIKPRTQGGFA